MRAQPRIASWSGSSLGLRSRRDLEMQDGSGARFGADSKEPGPVAVGLWPGKRESVPGRVARGNRGGASWKQGVRRQGGRTVFRWSRDSRRRVTPSGRQVENVPGASGQDRDGRRRRGGRGSCGVTVRRLAGLGRRVDGKTPTVGPDRRRVRAIPAGGEEVRDVVVWTRSWRLSRSSQIIIGVKEA